ncbi:hypothetical protein OIU74_009753 [Salix koriyanagi]|uniref:Uncharacterized protein n=1 Tax=Salix koriyanagi TaxID=2511006 RepID=A0A9Q0Z101_9ROSI|nr:hypothetical protein OIU74_009753 [Salix koriyanagi]
MRVHLHAANISFAMPIAKMNQSNKSQSTAKFKKQGLPGKEIMVKGRNWDLVFLLSPTSLYDCLTSV